MKMSENNDYIQLPPLKKDTPSDVVVIDYASKCVHIKGNALELTKLEYEIIEFLSMNPEMVFDKERIYEKIGGYDAEGDSRVVTELIRRIRKKMKMYSEHEYIATVWGS